MKDRFLPYDKNLKQFSRDLRNDSTLSEVLLWMKIKDRQIKGYQFLRQKPLDRYIADFYCQRLKLVIEVDGYSHADAGAQEYDQQRDLIMQGLGLYVMRVGDRDVERNIAAVVREIEDYVEEFERGNVG